MGRPPLGKRTTTAWGIHSLPLFAWRWTVDYQIVANPVPVSVIGTRLHTQF
jgi:hypothetical protein